MPFIQETLIYITGNLSVWKTGKCSETNVFIVQEYRPEFNSHFRCKNLGVTVHNHDHIMGRMIPGSA